MQLSCEQKRGFAHCCRSEAELCESESQCVKCDCIVGRNEIENLEFGGRVEVSEKELPPSDSEDTCV